MNQSETMRAAFKYGKRERDDLRAINTELVGALEEMLITHASDIDGTYQADPRLAAVSRAEVAISQAKEVMS